MIDDAVMHYRKVAWMLLSQRVADEVGQCALLRHGMFKTLDDGDGLVHVSDGNLCLILNK